MSNGAAKKLGTSRRKWKKTNGEYILRFTSIGLALIAIFYGLYVSGYFNASPENGTTSVLVASSADSALTESSEDARSIEAKDTLSPDWQNAERFEIRHTAIPRLKRLLMVAASMEDHHEAEVSALQEALASYFGIEIGVVSHEQATGSMADAYDGVIVLGNGDFPDTNAVTSLVEHLAKKQLPLFWLGEGFSLAAGQYGLEYRKDSGFIELPEQSILLYEGVEIDASGLPFVRGDYSKLAEESTVLATITLHGVFNRPAAFRKEQLTFIPFIPLPKYEARLTFAVTIALFSDVIGKHDPDPRVIFRLEDINARNYGAADTSFTKTIDFLLAENVPVHLGIIPRMLDQDGKLVADISDAPAVMKYVKKYPDKVITAQHGAYHFRKDQRNAGLASGDAWEFFFDDDDTMGAEASANFARERLESGKEIMKKAGMTSLMFEAPHYEMSPAQQKVADDLFPVMLHQPLFFGKETMFYSPTLAWFTKRGTTIYAPSSAGYVDALQEKSVEYILYNLEQLARILPDPVIFVYYHPFMSEYDGREDDLVTLIEGINKLGYRFINVLEELEPVTTPEE